MFFVYDELIGSEEALKFQHTASSNRRYGQHFTTALDYVDGKNSVIIRGATETGKKAIKEIIKNHRDRIDSIGRSNTITASV